MPRCVLLLLLWLMLAPAAAHTLSVTHLDITLPASGRDAQLELDLAIRDLALSLPLDANRDEQVTWGELDDAQDQVAQFVLSGLSLSSGAGRCDTSPTSTCVKDPAPDSGSCRAIRPSRSRSRLR